MNKKIQDMYIKQKESFFSLILLFLYFVFPFLILNLIFTFIPFIFGDKSNAKEAYSDPNNRTWILILSLAVIFALVIIESFVLKRSITFKVLYKHSKDSATKRIALFWYIFKFLLFIPLLSLMPEIWYFINKKKIIQEVHQANNL